MSANAFHSFTVLAASKGLDLAWIGVVGVILLVAFEWRDLRQRASLARATHELALDAKFFELSTDLVLTIDFAGKIISCNRAWTDQLGLTLDILRTEPFGSRIHPEDLEDIAGAFAAVTTGTIETEPTVLRFKHMDGTWRWLEWAVSVAQTDELVFASARDVTDRVELQQTLEIERRQLRSVQDIARIGSWHFEIAADKMYWSDTTYELLGIEPPDGLPHAELWLSSLDPAEQARGQERLADAIVNGGEFTFDFQRAQLDRNGEPVHIAIRGFAERGPDGRTKRLIGTLADVSERKRYQDGLKFIADHDPLTGLPNRRKFDDAIAKHVAHCNRYGARGALLMIDLDKLKHVNDELGHLAGDEMIKSVADALRERLRDTDIGARIGGDEFAVLLTDTTHEGARLVARSVAERLKIVSPELREHGVHRVTASIGIAHVEDLEEISTEAILTAADDAMYAAKRSGPGNVRGHYPRKLRSDLTSAV